MQALSWNRRRGNLLNPHAEAPTSRRRMFASMVIDTGHDRTRWLAMAALGGLRLELA